MALPILTAEQRQAALEKAAAARQVRAEIKDRVAYRRLLRNPRDSFSLSRVLNVPPRGIGKTTQAMLDERAAKLGATLWDVLEVDPLESFPARATTALRAFKALIHQLRAVALELPLPALLDLLLVHGILHLLGYDHLKPEDQQTMRRHEEDALNAMKDQANDAGLLQAARTAREQAYVPYSNYRVGAALLGTQGQVFTGCNIETLLVIAAKNSMKNQQKPKKRPPGISAKTFGKALKPSPKVPCCVAAIPKKMNAAGRVINPPRQTSKNSFTALAVHPLSATASFFRR